MHTLSPQSRSLRATVLAGFATLLFAGSASATVVETDLVPVDPPILPGDEIHSSSAMGSGRPELDVQVVRDSNTGKVRRVGRSRRSRKAAGSFGRMKRAHRHKPGAAVFGKAKPADRARILF